MVVSLHPGHAVAPYGTGRHAGRRLERWTAVHAGLLVIAAAWGFGGNIHWMRLPLALWGTLGVLLTVGGLTARLRQSPEAGWPILWLLPWLGYNALVLLSTLNPNYGSVQFFDAVVVRPVDPPFSWLPSCARPGLALRELWLYDGLFLAGYNLALNVRRRRVLRGLLLALLVNGVLLAIFGTVQKLTGATGLFFGAQPSPNPAFFASFIYHNHWGPFALLSITAGLALTDHVGRRVGSDGFWHSPAPALLCAIGVVAAAIPLSTSRSSTLLLLVLTVVTASSAALRFVRRRRERGRAYLAPLVGTLAGLVLAASAVMWLSRPILQARLAKTQEQWEALREAGGLGGREVLYRNTWRMALDRPWTGWGLESYRTVFVRYNTEGSPRDHLIHHYDQAHSDWLQSLAETGFIGTALLVLTGILPLWSTRRALLARGGPGRMLLGGCALIVTYAWVEFPFANPAVTVAFWVLFFAGVRYTVLSESE